MVSFKKKLVMKSNFKIRSLIIRSLMIKDCSDNIYFIKVRVSSRYFIGCIERYVITYKIKGYRIN